MESTVSHDELRAALEAALEASNELWRARMARDLVRAHSEDELPPHDPPEILEQKFRDAVAGSMHAHVALGNLISEAVGDSEWAVLLCGHIVHWAGSADHPPRVIPIERIIRLDGLRTFP